MDQELKAYLVAMEARTAERYDAMEARIVQRIEASYVALRQIRDELMALMNNQHERLINDLKTLRTDFVDTKDFLLRDAATRGRHWLDLEERVSKLERKKDTE